MRKTLGNYVHAVSLLVSVVVTPACKGLWEACDGDDVRVSAKSEFRLPFLIL